MKKILLSLITLLLGVTVGYSQSIKLESGSLDFLKGVTAIDLSFAYPDNMMVGKITEKEYIKKKVREYNDKESGKGDKWLVLWKGDRETRYQPMFEQLFAKNIGKAGAEISGGDNANYMIIITTTRIEPGFNVGVVRNDAEVDLRITFVEKSNPDKVLATVVVRKAPGMSAFGNDYDAGERIKEAYAKAGKEFGKFLVKKMK